MRKTTLITALAVIIIMAGCNNTASASIKEEPQKAVIEEVISSEEALHKAEEQEIFKTISGLNDQAKLVHKWYFGGNNEVSDTLEMIDDNQGYYYKVGRFSSVAQLKHATEEIFSPVYCNNILYNYAFRTDPEISAYIAREYGYSFSPDEEASLFQEIGGALYRYSGVGNGEGYNLTGKYQIIYQDDKYIVINLEYTNSAEEINWDTCIVTRNKDGWHFIKYFQFSPYKLLEDKIEPAVFSGLTAVSWDNPDQLDSNILVDFYIHQYLKGINPTGGLNEDYSILAEKVMDNLSANFEGLELETLTSINHEDNAAAKYNQSTNEFLFQMIFDSCDFLVLSTSIEEDITYLEVLIIGSEGIAEQKSLLGVKETPTGYVYVNNLV